MNWPLIFKTNWFSLLLLLLLFIQMEPAAAEGFWPDYNSAGRASFDDSLRTERRGEKPFVVHRVDPGETLYAIARRYRVTVDEIKAANNGLNSSISVGQVIFVPAGGARAAGKENFAAGSSETLHQVEAGQTLYAISRLYDVTVDELKSWNDLQSNELSAGQKLVVKKPTSRRQTTEVASSEPDAGEAATPASYPFYIVQPSETLYSISRKFNVSVEDIKEWSKLSSNSLSVGQRIVVGKPGTLANPSAAADETPDREKKKDLVATNGSMKQINRKGYTSDTTQLAGYEKVIEEGFAQVIENSPDTNKFLALHRTAPIGAILEVKNRMNDRSIYVRVVGTLPDTGVNNKVLIRLSRKAFERLGSLDPRVPVEVSYVP